MSDKIFLNNLPVLTINEIVKTLSISYISFIKNNIKFKEFPSVMLWGPPGVGKSQSIREIAKEIEENTKKKVNITDVRLLLFNPIDLRGIPTANADKTLAVWLKPKIFEMDVNDNIVNILFLDEISACPQSVQAAAYQITLDRMIGEHKLPDNCIVVAAGNRVSDRSVASKMPKALANRLMHIEVSIDFDSWFEWAKTNGINDMVLKFLENNHKYLMRYLPESDDVAYATPRTWEMVSKIMNNINDPMVNKEALISGLIGKDVAIEFIKFNLVNMNVPNVKDIFFGDIKYEYLTNEQLYVLKNNIINKAFELSDDYEAMKHSFLYIKEMPDEYAVMIMKTYNKTFKDAMWQIIEMPEYKEWIKKVKGNISADI